MFELKSDWCDVQYVKSTTVQFLLLKRAPFSQNVPYQPPVYKVVIGKIAFELTFIKLKLSKFIITSVNTDQYSIYPLWR